MSASLFDHKITRSPQFLLNFFERNLFERIIIYLFLAEFIVKLIFEVGLGQWAYLQPRNKQWIFYGFLGLDYLISFRKLLQLRVTVNPISLLALLLLTMILHGLFVGFFNHNPLFALISDTIPLTMIILNILRMQSQTECIKPIDFKFLLYATTSLAAGTCILTVFASLIGLRSAITIPVNSIYCPLILAAAFKFRPFPPFVILVITVMLIAALSELNRTTMAFFVIVLTVYTFALIIKAPLKGIIILIVSVLVTSTVFITLPEESSTYQRILGLGNLDLNRRTGSIGERAEEFDSIKTTIAALGETQQWVGLGFGGLYELQATHQYVKNYGHAHYAWAWFNLRFGFLGYFYLIIFVGIMIFNGVRSFLIGSAVGVFVALLCFMGLLYTTTYVNAIFLLNGLHFLRVESKERTQ